MQSAAEVLWLSIWFSGSIRIGVSDSKVGNVEDII